MADPGRHLTSDRPLDSLWAVTLDTDVVLALVHVTDDDPLSYAMGPDEFRRRGHEAVEWVARYLETVEDLPVQSVVQPGKVRSGLAPHPPASPEPFEDVLADLDRVIVPGITHWQSPNFYAYFQANSSGPSLADPVAYTSTEAHSSVLKGARVAGLADAQLRLIETDASHAMEPGVLAAAITSDVAAGRRPFFVAATVGTTSSHAIDPVGALAASVAASADRTETWLHVDGAHAGAAAVCPELRFVNDGLDLVDSYCVDPHKGLFTAMECDVMYVADRAPLVAALSVTPEYLCNAASDSGQVIDYRDWHLPLGRRFRALKLWFVLRHYGAEGLAAAVRSHVALAQELAGWVEDDPRFELAAPVPLNLVCFRVRGDDQANQGLLDAANASGRAMLSPTRLDGRLTLRMSVGQTTTARRHVEASWALIGGFADAILSEALSPEDPPSQDMPPEDPHPEHLSPEDVRPEGTRP